MTTIFLPVATAAHLLAIPLLAQGQQGVNLDFESGGRGPDAVAVGWRTAGGAYAFALDSAAPHSGRYSMRTQRVGAGGFGLVSQTVSVTAYAGGTVRLSGFVRSEGISEGYAGLWARVDGVRPGFAMDNMSDRGVTGDSPWTRYEIELPVDDCGTEVVFGPFHPGNGTAWFDDLRLSFEPAPPRSGSPTDCSPLSQEFNLDFERQTAGSEVPQGWLVERDPQGVTLDEAVSFSGHQSLRLDGRGDTAETRLTHQLPIGRIAGGRITLEGRIRNHGALLLRIQGPDSTVEVRSEPDPGTPQAWSTHRVQLDVDRCAAVGFIGVEHLGDGTAWFDRLALTLSGVDTEATVAETIDAPDTDRESLLSDAELAIGLDDCAPAENDTWTTWATDHARPLRSITSEDFSDLQFLKDVLGDKRVVQLGESGHGIEPFNMVKTRLIQFLHQEMGFDVIAFESSLEECYHANAMIDESTGDDLMRNCIFGVWHTAEVVELFDYIKQTATTSRPLILAGFDTQTSSRLASSRPARLKALIARVDQEKADRVEEMDIQARARVRGGGGQDPPLTAVRDSLIALYEDLRLYLEDNADEIAASPEVDPGDVAVAIQGVQSMIHFIRQMTAPGIERVIARDSGMADNLDFLLDVLYPEKKVITWGHNFHIRHRNQDVSPDPMKTMGAWVAERRRDEMYTVGLYMYRGEAALNNRQVYDVFRATSGSLESILHRTGLKYQFVDLAAQTRQPGTEWMFVPITAKTWGRSDVTMILRDQYDGILFIDKVWAPTYR